MIEYRDTVEGLEASQLVGFFVDWPRKPTPQTHLTILRGSSHVVVAIDDQSDRVVGFVTAVSDGVLSAYIPLLEVLPEYQDRGIGSELMRRILEQLETCTWWTCYAMPSCRRTTRALACSGRWGCASGATRGFRPRGGRSVPARDLPPDDPKVLHHTGGGFETRPYG